jgi:TonB family protein
MRMLPERSRGYMISAAAHLIVLGLLHIHSAPMYIKPVSIAYGHRTTSLVYLAKHGESTDSAKPLSRPSKLQYARQEKSAPKAISSSGNINAMDKRDALQTGNPYGSSSDGPFSGADIRPALPLHFPDPAVPRSLVPAGVQGDVIVEVTIDASGNVIETKLLRSVGYGIDERVLDTVRGWRFRPATRDGVAIASKQDVLYHFPS